MDSPTSLGGRQPFPSTCWSRFHSGFRTDTEEARTAAETLVRSYWKPIYAYIRTKRAKSNEDAKDLTQEFFIWMMESGFLQKADRDRGRFRSFVMTAIDHYLSDHERWIHREKRGGGRKFFALEAQAGELEEAVPAAGAGQPAEQLLLEAWRRELFSRAEATLEKKLAAEGKVTHYEVFRDYYLTGSGELDYAAVAKRYGISTTDVSNFLMNAKRRFQQLLTDLVAETVASEEDLQDELRILFGPEKNR